jgi:DNA-directed RNA polymerase I subunit RPA1
MGAVDRGVLCATCGLNDLNCPGHPGHLELDFPVYHPLLFASVFQLVRSSCSCCHRLRLSNSHIWPYLAKLKLLEMDDVVGAEEIDDKLLPQTMFDGVDVEDGDGEEAEPEGEDLDDTMAMDEAKGDSSEDERPRKKAPAQKRPSRRPGAGSSSSGVGRGAFDSTPEPELDASAILADVDSRFRAYCRRRNRRPPGVFARNKQQEVIAAFNRECIKVKKCEVCGERSPTIRKDGYTKMFAKPLPKNAAKLTSKNRLLYGGYTALEHVQKEEAGEQVGAVPDDSDIDSDMDEPAEVYDGLVDNSSEDEEEEDEESESEGEEEAKGGESVSRSSDKGKAAAKNKVSKKGKGDAAVVADEYLAPEQVEATLKLLWRYHPEILDAVHGRAQRGLAAMETPSAEGWRVFFLRAILVPANRFRPEAIVGDTQSDHPKTSIWRRL